MGDDHVPLSSYATMLDNNPEKSPDAKLFQGGGFWNGLLSNIHRNQIRPMKIRMIENKQSRSLVSERPDLKPSVGPTRTAVPINISDGPRQSQMNTELTLSQSSVTLKIQEITQNVVQKSTAGVESLEKYVHNQGVTDEEVEANLAADLHSNDDSRDPTRLAHLSELLLQALLKLDGIQVESDWTEARTARKEGVRQVQNLLDRLDKVKSQTPFGQNHRL